MSFGRGTANALAWHPDGDIVAVGARTGLWLYDDTLEDLAHFDKSDRIVHLDWSATGDMLATLDADGILQVWSVTIAPYTLSLQQTWTVDNTYRSWDFAWSPNGASLAAVTLAGAKVFDVQSGEQLLTIPDLRHDVTWHPDGTQLAGAVDLGDDIGEQVRVWDVITGEEVTTYISPDPYLYWSDIQWSPDGLVLVGVTSMPAMLHAWDVETGELLSDVETFSSEFSAYFYIWWDDDGQQLFAMSRYVSGRPSAVIGAWDLNDWTPTGEAVNLGDVWRMEKHPHTNQWVYLSFDNHIVIRDISETEVSFACTEHGQAPAMLDWSPDSQYLAGASQFSQTIQVMKISQPDEIQSIARPHSWMEINNIHWSDDGNAVRATLEHTGFTAPGTQVTGFVAEMNIVDNSERVIHETDGHIPHDGSDSYLPFSNWSDDFTRMATVLDHEPITLWTVETSENGGLYVDENIATIANETYNPTVIWSPDKTMVALIKRDNQNETSAWVYDAETGELIHQLSPSFPATLYNLSWSPDSTMVALVSSRGIAGSGETEYRLDVLGINPSSEHASYIVTVVDNVTGKKHVWHPDSQSIAMNNSAGIGIYAIENIPLGITPTPVATIPDIHASTLAWSPDGKWLAGSRANGTISIWDVMQN